MGDYKKWVWLTILLILLPLAAMGAFNYYIDPLWNFSHSHQYNSAQMPFDERQQKTNYLTFTDEKYDSLLLGSSRCTYINQRDFVPLKTYNYALSNLLMEEYAPYIKYAAEKQGHDFAYIILGLDFFATNLNTEKNFQPPLYYIEQANSFLYRYKTLFSKDVFKYSLQNFRAARAHSRVNFTYDRHNVKTLNRVSRAETEQKIAATVEKYRKDIYANYEYAPVKEILQSLKDCYPESRFIVFTTPVSPALFQLIIDLGLYPYYEQWLRDATAVFGELYHFMYPNSVTLNLDNFYDGSHVYPEVGTWIAHRITRQEDPSIPADFGMLLTPDNIDQKLKEIAELAKKGQ